MKGNLNEIKSFFLSLTDASSISLLLITCEESKTLSDSICNIIFLKNP